MTRRFYYSLMALFSIPFLLLAVAIVGAIVIALPIFVFINPDLIVKEKEVR